ncbi:hypothetical protein Bhyg_16639, partial [Pseudolycoriella hygida]
NKKSRTPKFVPRNDDFDFSRSFIRFTTHVNSRLYIIRHNEFRVRFALSQSASDPFSTELHPLSALFCGHKFNLLMEMQGKT